MTKDRFNLFGGMDWVDCSLYLMFAYAHFTDWKLDDKEIQVITEKAELFIAHMASFDNMPYTHNDVNAKMKKALEWYDRSLFQGDEQFLKELNDVQFWIQNQEWFNPIFAQNLVNWIGEIARADGKIIDNEIASLKSLAKSWRVESPI